MTVPQRQKPVLIAGAGIASLLFAQSLLRSKIPFQIFERDASLLSRGQGYRLRLSGAGLDAIEEVLEDDFSKFYDRCSKTGGSGFQEFDAISGLPLEHAVVGMSLGSRDGKIVGCARRDMRVAFMEGCEEHTHWDKQVTGYQVTDDGVRVTFADGTRSDEGQLLVGGEGIRSAVAKQVSGGRLKVYDTGGRGIQGQAPTTAFKTLGEGVFRFMDTSRANGKVSVITNVRPEEMDDPNIRFGWTLSAQPGVIEAPNDDYSIVGKQIADLAKSLTADWNERFRPLFDNMIESEAAFWKITCSTPSGVPEWPNVPRVTVIGDAAHSMTPAGGNGANTALRDSALLGRLIRESGGYVDGLTARYEEEMRKYASVEVGKSYEVASRVFDVVIDESTKTITER